MSDITKCPHCGDDRITQSTTYEAVIRRSMKTGRVIYRDKKPELSSPLHWHYFCSDCGWVSETFVE